MIGSIRALNTALVALVVFLFAACQTEQEVTPEVADDQMLDTLQATDPSDVGVAKLNLNTATEAEFMTIPGVGERMVGEFMEYRPYVSIQQFRRDIGKYVTEEQVAAYEGHVFVPVEPDESDAETVQQLPGIDADEAEQLVAGRPYGSRDAFLTRLSDFATPEEVTQAENYLVAQ